MERKAKYSKELKLEIVKKYLKGESATALENEYLMPKSMDNKIRKLAHKYEVNGEASFDNLSTIKSYSKDLKQKAIKEYIAGGISFLDIANKYVIVNDNDYKGAADKYSVPYASVYQWVSKFNERGEAGLSDRRGRPSTAEVPHELTELEKKDIEIEKLKRELERQKMVVEVLKKNIEIQERMERDSRLLGRKTNTKR